MIGYLIPLVLAGLAWLWFDRQSRKPRWGRVHADVPILEAMRRVAAVIRRDVLPAFGRVGVAMQAVADLLPPTFGAIPVYTSDLVKPGTAYLIDVDAAREMLDVPPDWKPSWEERDD